MSLIEPANSIRRADAVTLAKALRDCRCDTLETVACFARTLDGLVVPRNDSLNPPLWELGHIGWFQEYWIARNPQWLAGVRADPDAPRSDSVRDRADSLYHSSHVPHDTRWTLALPDLEETTDDLTRQLATTLALLHGAGDSDDALYFFRLALLHEDMHHEAALYMAQSLGAVIDDPRWQPPLLKEDGTELLLEAGPWTLGSDGRSFAFDNELSGHVLALPASVIDSQVVRWADFLPFVESGGYDQQQWWSDAGRAWIAAERVTQPRYTRRDSSTWWQWRHGQWSPLEMNQAACHLTAFEAQAWCRWAGRRLPTEAEWERAAILHPDEFQWGQVWEWTASPFLAYPGFVPHPYRDYSAPWFGSRTVLKGASFMTQPRMHDPRYRNFFMAQRNDVPAGFRTCRL